VSPAQLVAGGIIVVGVALIILGRSRMTTTAGRRSPAPASRSGGAVDERAAA
jgi:hypothetical protein